MFSWRLTQSVVAGLVLKQEVQVALLVGLNLRGKAQMGLKSGPGGINIECFLRGGEVVSCAGRVFDRENF